MNVFVTNVASTAWAFAITVLAIAVISTASIQMIKDMLPVRRWFQESFLRKWLNARAAEARRRESGAPDAARAEKDLVHLATGGDTRAFYNLEIEQLCGQMNSAAQIVLAYAARHENLLHCLAPEADPADMRIVVSPPQVTALEGEKPSPMQSEAMTALLDARNRLAHHVQRGIDALQISMGFRWKLILQMAAYAICFVVALIGVFRHGRDARNLLDAVVIGIVAGFVSPIVRDLMAVISRFRKP